MKCFPEWKPGILSHDFKTFHGLFQAPGEAAHLIYGVMAMIKLLICPVFSGYP